MDAHRPRALVARAPVGICNVRALVHPTPIQLMNSGFEISLIFLNALDTIPAFVR
jgi:hypothetical protein